MDESVVQDYLKQMQSEPTSFILLRRRIPGHSLEELEAMRQILVERQKDEHDLDLTDLDLTPPTKANVSENVFCTWCGQQIANDARFCTYCGRLAGMAGRRMAARVFLALAGLWIVVKVLEVISSGGLSAQALDITNPSLLGIVGFSSLIAYFFVRPRK
ncbi:MAG: zinc ribbon domain-containing protein [Bryobacteraceae bacterium]|jgi:hypothetical protein